MQKEDFCYSLEGNVIKATGIMDGEAAEKLSGLFIGDTIFTIDFSNVEDVKFSGLRALLRSRQAGHRFFVINASERIAEKFEDTGVSSFVNICRKPKHLDISKYEEFGASFLSKAYNSADGDSMIKVYGPRVPKWLIAQEKNIAKAVMLFGIPTPLVGTLYEDESHSALDFERIEGKRSFSRIIAEEPERLEEMSIRFARMCKKLHTTKCDTFKFADRSIYYRQAIANCKQIDETEKAKALEFLNNVPAASTCLHGDMQLSNVITNGIEDMWIDLSDFGYGNPMFDMGMWYFQAVFIDEAMTRRMYHFGKDTMALIWRIYIREYFGADTEDKYNEIMQVIEPFGALHMLYLGSTYGFEGPMLQFIKEKLLK